jgi:hypothetical protein
MAWKPFLWQGGMVYSLEMQNLGVVIALLLLANVTALSAVPATNPASVTKAGQPAPALERLDLNHDGRISLEEFYHTGPPPLHPRMKQVFDSFDHERQGSLSYAETKQVIATVSGLRPKLTPVVDGAFGPIALEVSPQTKRALVRATINGLEGRFLLDTGTSDTILDTEFARQAGVDFVEICTPIVAGNYGKKGDIISLVRVPDMQIAGTHFRDFHAVLREEGKPRRDFPSRLAGILGANVLFARPLTLDYRQHRLAFATNSSGPHEFNFDLVPNHRKTAALEAEIDGVKVILMLDSGAAIGDTILINETYQAAVRQLAGEPEAKQYQAKEVRVGGTLLLANQRCILRPFEEAVIGSHFFDRNVITIDLAAGKVWIDRNP